MVETIRTERLVLRPLRASDAGPITLHASAARVAVCGLLRNLPRYGQR